MLEALMKIFGKKEETGKIARDRLKVVLIHDRANISPEVMDNLKNDIIKVISNYMEINQQDMDISLANDDDSVALVANIPVSRRKHDKGEHGEKIDWHDKINFTPYGYHLAGGHSGHSGDEYHHYRQCHAYQYAR